jgi:hypothetical protein
MSFAKAVKSAPAPVSAALQPGKKALKAEHRARVDCADPHRFTGSIDLDGALQSAVADENRWDYGLGFLEGHGKEVALWIEVHPASDGEVLPVLKKLKWLRTWLQTEAPKLYALSRRTGGAKAFFWLATKSSVSIGRNSRKARLLQEAGLDLPRRKLVLA